jgi:hypothetical protein
LTGKAPCCGGAFFLHPAAVNKIDNITALIRKFFIAAV